MEKSNKKYSRRRVGSVLSGKPGEDGKATAPYIKFTEDFTVTAGSFLSLESKAVQLKSLQEAAANAEANGKPFDPEYLEKATTRIDNIPKFVLFEIVKVTKNT